MVLIVTVAVAYAAAVALAILMQSLPFLFLATCLLVILGLCIYAEKEYRRVQERQKQLKEEERILLAEIELLREGL
jgi:large-conductance mechanosensitive channel